MHLGSMKSFNQDSSVFSCKTLHKAVDRTRANVGLALAGTCCKVKRVT